MGWKNYGPCQPVRYGPSPHLLKNGKKTGEIFHTIKFFHTFATTIH